MKKILIIEDEAVLGDVLLQKLHSSGYEAEVVRDGAKGLARISEWSPDLILLDLFLPTVNGFEILSQKKLDVKIAKIPVIVLTNSLHPTDGTEIEKLGAIDFLVKSEVTTEKIMESVKAVFDKEVVAGGTPVLSQGSLTGKNILLVEDDNFLGSILMSRLISKGAIAVHAKSGEAALEELKKKKPDLMLLDILLPGVNGFEILQMVRKNPDTKELPVIVISNFSQSADKEKAQVLGAQYLVKALVTADDIVSDVEKLLK